MYLGFANVVTAGPTGTVDFQVTPSLPITVGEVLTATATNGLNNTFEFSLCRTVEAVSGTQTFTVLNTNDAGPGSLRDAILSANLSVEYDFVEFAIPGGGPHLIQPLTPLPALVTPVSIDGYTQPGASANTLPLSQGTNATIVVALDGSLMPGQSTDGIAIDPGATGSVVSGLSISGFGNRQVIVNAPATITGNFIGTDATGDAAGVSSGGLNYTGIEVNAPGTVVGTLAAADRNLISGLHEAAVNIAAGAGGSSVRNNLVGTGTSGNIAIPVEGIHAVIISSPATVEGNLVSGNLNYAIRVGTGGDGSTVSANVVGLRADDTAALGNLAGIVVQDADGVTVTGNRIGGHTDLTLGYGIHLDLAANTIVTGNYVGTNAAGDSARPNMSGLHVQNSNGTAIDGNVISGNSTSGIALVSTLAAAVTDNLIGVGADGTTPLANGLEGITAVAASGSQVTGNTIVGNGGHGIQVTGVAPGNTISQNEIDANGGLGINLAGGVESQSVTANDAAPDADSGPNGLQNFPVLSFAEAGSNEIAGTLTSGSATLYRIEFFESATCDGSGNGEGASFTGSTLATTSAGGTAPFNTFAEAPLTPGTFLTATATNTGTGETSEFSACLTVTSGAASAPGTLLVDVLDDPAGDRSGTVGIDGVQVRIVETGSAPVTQVTAGGGHVTLAGTNSESTYTVSIVAIPAGYQLTGSKTDTGDDTSIERDLAGEPLPATVPEAGATRISLYLQDTGITLNLGADTASVAPGASVLPIASIPPTALLATLPGHLPAAPLSSIDIKGSPLSSIPLSSIPLSSITVNGVPLSSIPLSSIPLSSIRWEDLIEGTAVAGLPLQKVTVAQALSAIGDHPDGEARLASVTLAEADIASTAIQNLSLASLLLGSVPLSSIGGGALCAYFANCSQTLATVEVGGTPLSSIPLSSIALAETPLSSIMLSGTPLSSIPLSSIPLSSIPLSSIPLSSIPLSSIPLSSIPLSSIPLSSIGLCPSAYATSVGISDCSQNLAALIAAGAAADHTIASLPLSSINVQSSPLSSIPLSSIPLSSIDVVYSPLSSIPLSSIPLSSINVASSPLSSIPLSNIPLSSIPLSSIPLSSIGLTEAAIDASPLSSIPLSSINVIGTPLSSIPLSSIPLSSINVVGTWCGSGSYVEATTGMTCAALGVGEGSTLLALQLALDAHSGTINSNPLSSIPLSSIPLSSIPLSSIPLSSIDVQSVPLSSIPLSSIPLSSITVSGAPLSSITLDSAPLSSIDWGAVLAGTSLASTPLSSIELGEALDVVRGEGVAARLDGVTLSSVSGDVQATLGLYFGAGDLGGVFLAGRNLGPRIDLGDLPQDAMAGTLADLYPYISGSPSLALTLAFLFGEIDLGELYGPPLSGNLGQLVFGDLLVALLNPDDYAWEELPLDDLRAETFVTTSPRVTYSLGIVSTGGSTGVSFQLPRGFSFESAAMESAPVTPASIQAFDGVTVLTFDNLTNDGDATLEITAIVGLSIGIRSAGAAVTVNSQTAKVSGASLTVTDAGEDANDTTAGAVIALPDELHIAHIGEPTDVDYYAIPFPEPGSRIAVYLSHLGDDIDMVMYNPVVPELVTGRTARSEGTDTAPLSDAGAGAVSVGQAQESEALQDISDLDLPIVGISTAVDASEQVIETISLADEGGGYYYVRVSGYQDRWSDDAYVLRVKVTPPQSVPQCQPRRFPYGGLPDAPGTLWRPAGASGAVDSIFIVNQDRMARLYGSAAAASVVSEIQGLLASSAFAPNKGGILFADGADGYEAFDTNPCDPAAANSVVESINGLVDSFSTSWLKHIVVVGSDDVVPFARTPDLTRISNEYEYASTIADTRSGTWAAFATGSILTDDPYGDFDPIPWLNRYLYVPDVALGRLVESPAEIIAQVDLFEAAGGALDPDSAVVTGYDFLRDGADEVGSHLAGAVASIVNLVNDTWGREDLLAAVKPAAAAPADIVSLNAHFDHYRLLPADENFVPSELQNEAELVSSTDLADLQEFDTSPTPRIFFSMGCHSGLNLADYLVGSERDPRATDWAQVMARNGAIFVGQTGFGYGDTASVALSERLMALFSERLDGTLTAGQALTFAKQQYFATLGLYGVYDEKVLMESTFYGLPMYRLGSTPLPSIHELGTATDPVSGLQVARIRVSPDLAAGSGATSEHSGSYFQAENPVYSDLIGGQTNLPAEGGTQNTHYRPIQPRVSLDVSQSETGRVARGAVIEALSGPADLSPFNPIFHIPVVDDSSNEPERSSADGVFPAGFQTIARYTAPDGPRENLVVIPGQFFFDGLGAGVQRRFEQLDATVYYSASADASKPLILRTDAEIYQDTAEFVVDTDDGEGEVIRVVALYLDGSNSWTKIELTREGTTTRWIGEAPVAAGSTELDYFVQVVDAAGNVGVSSAKGTFFVADAFAPPPPIGDAVIGLAGELLPNGQYNQAVEFGIAGAPAVIFTYSLDGVPPALYEGPVTIETNGLHTIVAFGTDGSRAFSEFAIERIGTQLPGITISSPIDGATYSSGEPVIADFACEDAGNGLVSCVGTTPDGSPINTATAGIGSFTVTATDAAGRVNVLTVSYSVGNACAITPTITGTSAGEVINGTPGNDVIRGNGGNDTIHGNGGNDIICAGSGNDSIVTLGGNDVIDAGNGNNTVDAGGGNNNIRSGKDNDQVTAGTGNDTIDAGNGTNTITDAGGNNTILTGKDDDAITAGGGADIIDAGNGENSVDAGAGNNKVTTGKDGDIITAGAGDDVILAGNGDNTIQAGDGQNSVTAGKDNDEITTGSGNDTIDAGNGKNKINAGGGTNSISTGKDNDEVAAGPGNDTIDAGNGDNIINAGDGNNTVTSGKDKDTITTGSGNDVIQAGNGANVIQSGGGDDSLLTGKDADNVNAGGGTDTCTLGGGANVHAGCEVLN